MKVLKEEFNDSFLKNAIFKIKTKTTPAKTVAQAKTKGSNVQINSLYIN